MQYSQIPAALTKAFAASGDKNAIPTDANSSTLANGLAAFSSGFPPVTSLPASAGGQNPVREDFNGVLGMLTTIHQWQMTGSARKYESTFSTAIGGYPNFAVLVKSSGSGFWISTADNNTTDPDSVGSANWKDLSAFLTGSFIDKLPTGTVDAMVASITLPTLNASFAGVPVFVRAIGANTSTMPTYGGKTIVKGNNLALVAGDIIGWMELQYDATWDKWVLLNPATGVSASAAASIQGAFKNLQASSPGLSANVSVTADEIAVESAANEYKTLRGVNLAIAGSVSGVANGLDTGAIATSTWYSVWVIWNGVTTAGLLSLSATAPTLPAGYTHKARVGWVRTDSTANKYPLAFKQYGRRVQYAIAAGSNLTAIPNIAAGVQGSVVTPTWAAVGISAFVPSTASVIDLVLRMGNGMTAMAAPNNGYGNQASTSNPAPLSATVSATTFGVAFNRLMVLESTNIYYASDNAGNNLYCAGWEDNL